MEAEGLLLSSQEPATGSCKKLKYEKDKHIQFA
jgi:hypothetical protein